MEENPPFTTWSQMLKTFVPKNHRIWYFPLSLWAYFNCSICLHDLQGHRPKMSWPVFTYVNTSGTNRSAVVKKGRSPDRHANIFCRLFPNDEWYRRRNNQRSLKRSKEQLVIHLAQQGIIPEEKMSIPIGTPFRSFRSSSTTRSGEHLFSPMLSQHTSNVS